MSDPTTTDPERLAHAEALYRGHRELLRIPTKSYLIECACTACEMGRVLYTSQPLDRDHCDNYAPTET